MRTEPRMILSYSLWQSPVGLLGIALSENGLSYLYYVKNENDFISKLHKTSAVDLKRNEEAIIPVTEQLTAYFDKKIQQFRLPIDILTGTEFEKKVWSLLQQIPYGEVKTYQWFSEKLKVRNGARAVGTVNGKNPISIILPCHRVINSNGKLGGYSGGLEKKRWLLKLEGSYSEFDL